MGDLLLSILGFDADNVLIYTRHLPYSSFKVGDKVRISYPNPNRVPSVGYYRIYDEHYGIEAIRELILTQDSNVIDRNMVSTPMLKHLRDKEMYEKIASGQTFKEVGKEYKWHQNAVRLAIKRHANWLHADTPTTTVTPPLVPTPLTQEQRDAKVVDLLANWD